MHIRVLCQFAMITDAIVFLFYQSTSIGILVVSTLKITTIHIVLELKAQIISFCLCVQSRPRICCVTFKKGLLRLVAPTNTENKYRVQQSLVETRI